MYSQKKTFNDVKIFFFKSFSLYLTASKYGDKINAYVDVGKNIMR